eukprot:6544041-Alexandrium_andersonii.AAC.1
MPIHRPTHQAIKPPSHTVIKASTRKHEHAKARTRESTNTQFRIDARGTDKQRHAETGRERLMQ